MLADVEIVVDLQTGTISMILRLADRGEEIELESVSPDDAFAPRE